MTKPVSWGNITICYIKSSIMYETLRSVDVPGRSSWQNSTGLVLALPPNMTRLQPISLHLIGKLHFCARRSLHHLFIYASITFYNKFNWLENKIDTVESIKVQVCGNGVKLSNERVYIKLINSNWLVFSLQLCGINKKRESRRAWTKKCGLSVHLLFLR